MHSRLRKVINMKEGHKRHNYEKRVDLAGEYRWGDVGQLLILVIFSVFMIRSSMM